MTTDSKYNHALISNDFVKCYSDHLVIHLYYFPYGDKKLQYSDIQSCELVSMQELGFTKVKMWGMALSPIWWHCDFHRHGREHCIILNTNHWPKIGLTMDDKDIMNVYNFIKEKLNANKYSNDNKNEKNNNFESISDENVKTK